MFLHVVLRFLCLLVNVRAMHLPQYPNPSMLVDTSTAKPRPAFRNIPRNEPSVEGAVEGPDAHTQSLLDPED